MKPDGRARKWLEKKVKRGMHGYPIATLAFYGPDNRRATKVAVGIVLAAQSEPADLRRWSIDAGDVRTDDAVLVDVVMFLRQHDVRSVAMANEILGCPHEEGIDYPIGGSCPLCSYWANRDRWTGAPEAN